MDTVARFEALLARGQDSAMLRLTLGQAYLARGETDRALEHLGEAVRLDADYSAAWKLIGRAELERGDLDAAERALTRGLAVAGQRGDKQAAREMQVFLRRVAKRRAAASG